MSKYSKLITPVSIPSQEEKISCDTKILTLGSCFSDHIGNCLVDHLFDSIVNPFGTVFNPVSLAQLLEYAIKGEKIEKSDLGNEGNRYFHYDFHSSFDASTPEKVVETINTAIDQVSDYIQKTDFLILTFGTSIVYRLKSNNSIVSNCHKVPNYHFQKEFLSVDFMDSQVNKVLDLVRKMNPSIKTIFTVSPVRHTKEGLVENNLSKSRLIELCHRLTSQYDSSSYFPSYEIMIDELRDYRYYASDLIHPSELAVDIIWTRFIETYFDELATQKVKDVGGLNAAKNHKPFDPSSSEHKTFKENQLNNIDRLRKIYREIDFEEMEVYFKK